MNVCAVGARKYYRSGWNIADTLVVFAGALDTIPGACHRATAFPTHGRALCDQLEQDSDALSRCWTCQACRPRDLERCVC